MPEPARISTCQGRNAEHRRHRLIALPPNATRDEAIIAAHASGGYSYQQIAEHFDVHFTTVGRIVRAAKQ